jgi:hypothetical protein
MADGVPKMVKTRNVTLAQFLPFPIITTRNVKTRRTEKTTIDKNTIGGIGNLAAFPIIAGYSRYALIGPTASEHHNRDVARVTEVGFSVIVLTEV